MFARKHKTKSQCVTPELKKHTLESRVKKNKALYKRKIYHMCTPNLKNIVGTAACTSEVKI